MLARSHLLLLKIDLSERVSKKPHRVGYWSTYTIYSIVYYILLTLLRKRNALITLSAMEIRY